MDRSILETHLVRHKESSLRVLAGHAGCAGLNGCLAPDAEILFLADLIGLLRRHYRFVFFDLPPLIGPASDYVFARSQYILLVGALTDISAVRDTASLYRQLLDRRIAPERIWLVANRVARQADLTVQDLEQAAGTAVRFQVPEDQATAVASINEGAPAVLSRPASALSRSVRELADLLEHDMVEQQRRRAAPAPRA
jgi:Flp pilus assembly CpaE family ATPase